MSYIGERFRKLDKLFARANVKKLALVCEVDKSLKRVVGKYLCLCRLGNAVVWRKPNALGTCAEHRVAE